MNDSTKRKQEKYRQHHWLLTNSVRKGARSCMTAAPTASEVRIARTAAGTLHVGGVQRCGSASSCPVCAPTIGEGRAVEVDAGIREAWAQGYVAVLITATVRHKLGDYLSDVLGLVQDSWRATWSGRGAKDWRRATGFGGSIRALEVTYGANGWHPHIHAVVFVKLSDELALEKCIALGSRFAKMVSRRGGESWVGGTSSPGWNCQIIDDSMAVAKYIAGGEEPQTWSAGHEVARWDVKTARSGGLAPFEILSRAADGAGAFVSLWSVYEKAMAGRRVMVWSRGLKTKLGILEVEDAELLDLKPDEVIVGEWFVPRETWQWWVRSGLLGVKLAWFDTEPDNVRTDLAGAAPPGG